MSLNFEAFDRPADLVETNLSAMNSRADETLANANAAIAALGGFQLALPPGPSLPDLPDVRIPSPVEPTALGDHNFGQIAGYVQPTFEDLTDFLGVSLSDLDITIPEFTSTNGQFILPSRPAPIDTSGAPDRPTLDDIDIPAAPTTSLPSVPTLVELNIPEFTFPTLPSFTDTAPTFDGVAPNPNLTFAEPEYASVLMSDLVGKVRSWLEGGTGLPPAIQQAIFDAARGRIQQTAGELTQKAFDDWAGRGFSMPPGMLVAQVNASNEKSRLEQNAQEREITVYISKTEIENLRFAMERGIAIEGLLTKIFADAAGRSFEIAKLRLDADLKLYDITVTLFNAKQTAYGVAAQVFKTRLEGALSTLEVYKAQIQGELAKGQVNESTTRAYEAQIRAVLAVVEMYKAQMDGARIAQDVNKGRIDAFKADIDAYGSRLSADVKRFDAYEAEVRAEAARAGAFESETRAYAETVRAQGERANVKVKYVDARIAAINAAVNKFTALSNGSSAATRASVEAVQARAGAFNAEVGRYTAEIQGSNVAIEASLRVQENRLRNLLANAELQQKAYDASMSRVVEQAKIIGDQLKAAGQYTSAMATGAMSAMRIGAEIGARGNVSSDESYRVQINRRGADTA